MDNKLEFIIPFLLISTLFVPNLFTGIQIEIANELRKLLFACMTVSIVIVVLRYLRKIEK